MNYSYSNGNQSRNWDNNPDHVENKKKIVSDLMALRKMKLLQSAKAGSSTYLDLNFTNNNLVSKNDNSQVRSLLEGTLLKDELDTVYGNSSLKRAMEHFSTLNSDQPNDIEENEIKRRHFLNNITSKRKNDLEASRKSRQQKQQQLINKQIELKTQSPTLEGSLQRPINVNDLVTDTEQNLKAMEHNLKYLKIRYSKVAPKKSLLVQSSLSFEYFKKSHPEQVRIAEWIIGDILLENVFTITQAGSADYDLLQTALKADHQQWEDYQLETAKYEAALYFLTEIVSEVVQEAIENICKECLHLCQLCVVVSEDIVINSASSVVPKSKISSKIVDETWSGIKSTRVRTHRAIWSHTQAPVREHEPEIKPTLKKTQAPIAVPITEDREAETISSENVIPKLTSHFGNLPEMKDFSYDERTLWSHLSLDSPEFSYSTKPMIKINVSVLNCDHSYVALGSQHGDIIVYNMLWQPSKMTRCVASYNKINDPVTQIRWSFDSCRLLTLRESGCLIVWSFAFAPYASSNDVTHLEFGQPTDRVWCQQLTALCILEAKKGDFLFQEGTLAENEKAVAPIMVKGCFFDNTLSSAASQDFVIVTLANGDILRCDLSEIIQQRYVDDLMLGLTRRYQAPKHILGNSNLKTDKVHKISQGIVTELFRYHRTTVVEIIFIGVTGDMISLDSNSNLLHWIRDRENFNNFGWFVPFKKVKLSFQEEVFVPKGEDTVVFEDRVALKLAGKGRRTKSKHIVEQERNSALSLIDNIPRSSLWHSDETPHEIDAEVKQKKKKFITRIYAPPTSLIDISAGGATFHVVMVKRDNNTLVKYAERTYESSNITSVTVLQRVLDQTANRIFFMLLFDEYLPKVRQHVTIVDFNLNDFKFGTLGSIQINLKPDMFSKLMSGNGCHFSISRVHEHTGSEYMLCNIAGTLHVYSILSGQRVLYGTTDKSKLASIPSLKLSPKMSKISPESKVLFVYPDGNNMYVIILPQVNIHLSTRIIILADKDPSEFRRNALTKYKSLQSCAEKDKGVIGWCPPEQQCHREVWTHRDLPVPVYVKLLIYKLLDISVARATGERMNQDVRKVVWRNDWLHMQGLFSIPDY